MTTTLIITVEAHWKGTVLEALSPVAALPLRPDPEVADLLVLGDPYTLTLQDGRQVRIWCARTATGRFLVEIQSEDRTLARAEADAPVSLGIELPDGKQYQFSIRVERDAAKR